METSIAGPAGREKRASHSPGADDPDAGRKWLERFRRERS
jgi:hypothetical protein